MNNKTVEEKIASCAGNDGCAPDLTNGKAIVDKVRKVGVSKGLLEIPHLVECSCKEKFQMIHFEETCPKCGMVYGVTPCSSAEIQNIKPAGINY